MNYKEAVCQAAIALWASAKPSYNSNPEAAVEQGVKIAAQPTDSGPTPKHVQKHATGRSSVPEQADGRRLSNEHRTTVQLQPLISQRFCNRMKC